MERHEPGDSSEVPAPTPSSGPAGPLPAWPLWPRGLFWGKLHQEEGRDWLLLTPSLRHMAPPPPQALPAAPLSPWQLSAVVPVEERESILLLPSLPLISPPLPLGLSSSLIPAWARGSSIRPLSVCPSRGPPAPGMGCQCSCVLGAAP